MHVPDHVIDPQIELAAGLAAAGVIASVLARSGRRPQEEGPTLLHSPDQIAPQAATAALVFALQMVNVPVLPGTSGHLLGGALATALVGPRRALLAVCSVVVVQALLFADGGLGALGVNVLLIAALPVAVATLARRLFTVDSTHGARWWASIGLGAAAAPVVSAAAFTALFVAGGTSVSPARLAGAMIGTHAAVARAEVVITGAAVALIAWAQARRPATGAAPVWGLAVFAAAGLSLAASSAPDGLSSVLGDLDIAVDGSGSILSGSPLEGYAVGGLDALWSGPLAGLGGLLAACALCAALALATRRLLGAGRAPVTA